MSYKELIPAEEYEKIRARDRKRAQDLYDFVMENEDSTLKYKTIRAVSNIKEMLETSTSLYADRPAFWEKPTHKEPYKIYTYTDALARVNALGTALHAHGLRGANIAVIGDNSYAWATAYLSVVCGTGVVVPLDKELSKDEIAELLVIAEVECI
jgi:long-chain acyl-CoA synthetase